MKPLMDLTTPQHHVASAIGRELVQWTVLDPMTTPVRAASRAYHRNQMDHERLHLEEAIHYLRQAPVGENSSELTPAELNTVIARLDLRKRLLGGLVNRRVAERVGEEQGIEEERIRSRNWELLRQCAEKTGLIFESLNVAGTHGEYGLLWFPLNASTEPEGTSLGPVWKLLNIKNPWTDERLKDWRGSSSVRSLDANGALLPQGEAGVRAVRLIPLGVYSMSYPTLPLLLIDFRDKLHIRRHELTQRAIDEVTSGVIGISHFTNWYYYVAADLYDFVAARRGRAMDHAARLDCYSQFRVALAMDSNLDGALRSEMQRRIDSLAVNPLEGSPERELQLAQARYQRLRDETDDGGRLAKRLDRQRSAELAAFGMSPQSKALNTAFHYLSFGLYTRRAGTEAVNMAELDRDRRVQTTLGFLRTIVDSGTQPEIAYDPKLISTAVNELSTLLPSVESGRVKTRAALLLSQVRDLTRDDSLVADCSLALRSARAPVGVAAIPRTVLPASLARVESAK
ncbi:MAG: hypothetical protein M3Y57_18490 [Acidobacteriota bacterium]|nr:hypothetical protein [Acidobacteriota bacterium]